MEGERSTSGGGTLFQPGGRPAEAPPQHVGALASNQGVFSVWRQRFSTSGSRPWSARVTPGYRGPVSHSSVSEVGMDMLLMVRGAEIPPKGAVARSFCTGRRAHRPWVQYIIKTTNHRDKVCSTAHCPANGLANCPANCPPSVVRQ